MESNVEEILKKADELSSPINFEQNEIAMILAAGHGKRIKSQKSKMLHQIYGLPTVERVYRACAGKDSSMNAVLVVGIKAIDVMSVIGKRGSISFAYQAEQKGTGHALQVGIERIGNDSFNGTLYVLPGDMGLLDRETMDMFRKEFRSSSSDMMVLTGLFDGPPELNAYGRIIRVKATDKLGNSAGPDFNKVIEIIENKDIQALEENGVYETAYNSKIYSYSKEELINNNEFNSGVYAFDYQKLLKLVYNLGSQNAQNEIYITDLIKLFNDAGHSVAAVSPKDQRVVMGFNDKSVLKEMDTIYRQGIYEKVGNILEIDDPEDFFIDESVIEQILEMDAKGVPLEIKIGKGVHIGKGVKLNYNIKMYKNVFVSGNIALGKNVIIYENAYLSCYPNQKFVVGDNVEILWGNIIKGSVLIGDNCRIESSVNITGSDDSPTILGKNVLIKGTSYIFGTIIEDDVKVEHSVLVRKKVNRVIKRNGKVQEVRYFLPMPAGLDAIEER